MALFTADTHFVVYMDARSSEPSMELHSRTELTPVFDDLNRYVATTHFNGQSRVTMSRAAATGESYCLAHHLSADGDERTIMIASIRYEDTFTKLGGTWLFSERRLDRDPPDLVLAMNDALRDVARWADRGDRIAIAMMVGAFRKGTPETLLHAGRGAPQAPTRRRTALTACRLAGTPERMLPEGR
jgi:hypothetical protein